LERWRKPRATHDPGKVVADLAVMPALGGDCLSDIAVLRAEPELFGPVPSDPTVSRLVTTLAQAGPQALRAIRKARAAAPARAWELAGEHTPGTGGTLIPVDLDATIVLAHSEKNTPPRPGSTPSGSTRCARSSTMAPAGPGRPPPWWCCGRATAGSTGANPVLPTPYPTGPPAHRRQGLCASLGQMWGMILHCCARQERLPATLKFCLQFVAHGVRDLRVHAADARHGMP
jgi:hypothetical protein